MYANSEQKEERLKLYTAIRTIDRRGYIYDPKVLDSVTVDSFVRVYYTVDSPNTWGHDSPFLSIIEVQGDELLGEIQDFNRRSTDKHPLDIYEKIWIKKEHIIEIPLNLQKDPSIFEKYLTNSKVTATGPLYTVDYQDDDSDSDSGYSD